MRRELSARYTFVYRWVIPGFLSVAAIAVIWSFAKVGQPGPPDTGALLAGVAIAVGLMVVARFFDRAKRVWIEGETLVVSAYGKDVPIPLGDVESVSVARFVKPDRVTIRFCRATTWGNQIVFFPPLQWRKVGQPHAVVTDVAAAAQAARESSD